MPDKMRESFGVGAKPRPIVAGYADVIGLLRKTADTAKAAIGGRFHGGVRMMGRAEPAANAKIADYLKSRIEAKADTARAAPRR